MSMTAAPDFIWAWKEDQGDVWTGEWSPVGDVDASYEAQEYALRALYAAVKDGTATITTLERLAIGSFPEDAASRDPSFNHVWAAYRGSLDAALALMQGVLPGWDYSIDNVQRVKPLAYVLDDGGPTFDGEHQQPAVALLLAILAALIAQDEAKGSCE